ncbi:MAG: ABC transporter substrate-binding protein [Gemmatimonadota bacterium]
MRRGARRWLGAMLVFAAAACGGGDSDGGSGGGIVVVGMRSDFGSFNPVMSSGQYDREVMNYALFTPLVQYDGNLDVAPYLAESWELTGDTGVVFHLRQDVTWHDGQPVTAHDVEFTFNLAKNEETASFIGSIFLADVAAAEVVDDYTIRFSFVRPHGQALEDFWWPPLPRHLLEDVAPAQLRDAPYNRQPVGSGPFRFGEWRANEQLMLERNDDFPEALGGPPAADRVVFRVVPEASTLLTELITGGIHADIPLLPDQASQVRENGELELHSFPGRTVYYLGWNNERPPFNDANLRRAMAHAINRGEIVEALLYGEGEIATSTIPPWHQLYPQGIEPVPHDIARATQLLEEAGWQDRDGDGVRENAQGQPLSFTILSSDDPLRRGVVEVLQSQLRQVGASVEIQVMEFQTMLQNHRERNFDAVFTNWVLDNFQLGAAPMALFHSDQASTPQSANRSGVVIPALDAAMERGISATDEAAQAAAWREFTEVLQREQPVTFMFWLNELAATRSELQGVEMDPRGELRSIMQWRR